MNKPKFILFLLLCTKLSIGFSQTTPNVVLIVADDLGYGDLSGYGADQNQTPRLDSLAREGARLTAFYSNGPECTPTRTALLTGRYQQRVGGLECAIGLGNIGRYDEAKQLSDAGQLGLPTNFSVLPDFFSDNGYRTAMVGKWHLGEGEAYQPRAHGFDYSIGPLGGAVDYFHHTEPVGVFYGTEMEGNHDFFRNGQPHHREGYYMTSLISDEAVQWINQQKEDQPFFLYIPYTAPHDPYQGLHDYQAEKKTADNWKNHESGAYADIVAELDRGVGQILDKLEEMGFAENTLVIFFSDNGPTSVGSAGHFRGFKGRLFEGGIRVPCILRWPGHISPGTVSDQTFLSMDITASLAAITQAVPERKLDGIDLIGHLTAGNPTFDRSLFWRKKRGLQTFAAARHGQWKYIREQDGTEFTHFLFDLAADPGEKENLYEHRAARVKQLQKLLSDWELEVQAER